MENFASKIGRCSPHLLLWSVYNNTRVFSGFQAKEFQGVKIYYCFLAHAGGYCFEQVIECEAS